MKQVKTIMTALFIIGTCTSSFAKSDKNDKMISNDTLFIDLCSSSSPQKTADIIADYVDDFKRDQHASNKMIFGIEVPNHGNWTVNVTGEKKKDIWEVILTEELPKTPTFIYSVEHETLLAMHKGTINAMTAQGKAFSGDYSPMQVNDMDTFSPTEEMNGKINAYSFHFWTRGFPEVIPFGYDLTRQAHGVNMVLFYYQKGFRSGWLNIPPKGKVRHDPREQAMPFPMLVIAIKGHTEGEMNGKRVSLSEGNALFIPAGTTHKWWNETNEATEAILIMFGEGA